MPRAVSSLALTSLILATVATSPALPAQSYAPPVAREARTEIAVWFGRAHATGKWCSFDRETFERRSKLGELVADEFGWARLEGRRVTSITHVRQSEDAYVEDRYFVGSNNKVERMVRTGHYITDPWLSVSFEPDAAGRLRLTAQSKDVVQKMNADGQETYFVDWDHFSRLSQIPFSKFLDRGRGQAKSNC